MNRQELKRIMMIVRPAIVAMFGRQPLNLIEYQKGLVYANTVERLYLRVKGREDVYKVEVQDDEVIELSIVPPPGLTGEVDPEFIEGENEPMVTVIQIKASVVEWLQERLGIDADEALEFAQEFAGMLYFTGAFARPHPNPRELPGAGGARSAESEVDPGAVDEVAQTSTSSSPWGDDQDDRAAQEGRDDSREARWGRGKI